MPTPDSGSPNMAETVSYLFIPVLIVTTGILFLADYHYGWTLEETWPILLIIGGLVKVTEHAVRVGG